MIYRKFFCSLPLTAFTITTFILIPVIAQGSYLRWNANHEADLAGYRAYYGTSSEQYDRVVNLGMVTQLKLSTLNLHENTSYYISITAYDRTGNESGLSDELYLNLDEEISDYFDNCPDIYNPDQEDTYPPGGNDRGDNCDCEGDFTCDGDVDGWDSIIFKADFGRNEYSAPCTDFDPCNGDFDCDGDVDASDAAILKADFGRNEYHNPCPDCVAGDWCAG
jgi:hypothetical protein